jgi:C4-dicarboxylate-specific signal transduction histidine kinase
MKTIKNNWIVIVMLLVLFVIFGLAGNGDYHSQLAQQCWNKTHSQSCANQ